MESRVNVMVIEECPSEDQFEAANVAETTIRMKVRDGQGYCLDVTFYVLGYSVLDRRDDEGNPLKCYCFQGKTPFQEELSGVVAPASRVKEYGELSMAVHDVQRAHAV